MRIYKGLEDFKGVKNPIVTSGTFDGVHLGHRKILKRIRQLAEEQHGETVLLTFWPHPRMVLYPDEHNLRLLNTFEEKAQLLEKEGIEHLVTIPFTQSFSQLSSEEYVQQILIEGLGTHTLVIGYDHRFGKNREGSFSYLKANIKQYGFALEEISREDIDNIGISSTKIRKALEEGDVKTAAEFLGDAYRLRGKVVKGEQLGRSIGFPTANIAVSENYKLIPGEGAYAVWVELPEGKYQGMLNIGKRPTVDGTRQSIEVNIFDFDGDLYGKDLEVSFAAYLRPEVKFEGIGALQQQLATDRAQALKIFQSL